MKRTVLTYGVVGGVVIVLLRSIEYRYLVVEHSLEIYGGLVALIFATLGIWLGLKFTRPPQVVLREVLVPAAVPVRETFVVNTAEQQALGVTKRELEILGFIAEGLSTKEIAERAFVSENTVKTHTSRLFEKLGAKRRIQVVQVARDRGLIP